ncbi:MAG: transcription-repair coupling factor [Burkholderiales bacterium]|nr:transcription-repair coupling factor [Bacteroidia bacterium]
MWWNGKFWGELKQKQANLNTNVFFSGLRGSSFAFLVNDLFQNTSSNYFIVCNDKEKAAYLLNDLQALLPEKHIHYFPESYKVPYKEEKTSNASVQERAEALSNLSKDNYSGIVVTYAAALAEKVASKTSLSKNTLVIKKGDKLSIDFIQEFLLSYDFELCDFVAEPGQYAIRGGIVDVYSFAHELPYRIELFGNDVDAIKTFDPASQLSNHNYDFVTIIPDIQSSQVIEVRQSIFDYISEGTVLCFDDVLFSKDFIDKLFEKTEKAFAALSGTIGHLPPQELYIRGEEFLEHLKPFTLIEYGLQKHIASQEIAFNQSGQPQFNKNFDMLINDLKANKAKGYKNYLTTDNTKQAERLHTIFNDLLSKEHRTAESLIEHVNINIHEGFIDHDLKIACYTDHQVFERYHRFHLKETRYKTSESLTLKEILSLNPGDFVTHIDHGIGRFGGLVKINANGKMQEAVKLVYKDNDFLYVSIHSLHRISKYTGKEGNVPRIDKIGSTTWSTLKQKTKKNVKEVAYDLIKLYAKRKAQPGHRYPQDNYLQHELEASFIYEDTPDQIKVTADVKKDMERPHPMDRLVCGDVGFGKTEIAIRAAFKAVCDSKQVAILVPTTILAYQHYKTFKERLKDLPCNVNYINRFRSAKEVKEIIAKTAEGKIDILIGTHKIVGKDIKFKDLGLLIIDEEQKFGVGIKDKLKTFKTTVDTLTLTATPIPRTLQFSLMGARDLSVISTPPANRYPVQTELISFSEEAIRDAISYELSRGGQVFFVHNKVQNIQEVAGIIQRLVPEARVAVGHGQMEGDKLEDVMLSFIEGEFDILVATTIIESGLDISNANTIIINDSQNFGLSDLHQMRGRVGRSNKKAFCYLLTPPFINLSTEARKRLKAIIEFSDLGSGFQIAMRDLDIRGAGNLLGGEQSGFINDMGFDTYMKILNEAIEELKQEHWYKETIEDGEGASTDKTVFSRQFVKETVVDTDLQLLIPDTYVSNLTERLLLYRELDNVSKTEELAVFESKLRDRFGPLPIEASELISVVRMRWAAMKLGFEKITLKNNKMLAYFLSKQDSEYYNSAMFKAVLAYAQKTPKQTALKEQNNKLWLTIENIRSVDEAIAVMEKITSMLVKPIDA